MKKLLWSLAIVMSLGPATLKAAGSFEGEVDMKMTTHNGKEITVQYFVKGHKARTQMEAEEGKFSGGAIYDWKTNQITMVMDKQKMYMVSQLHPEKYHYGNDKHYKITKTGRTETILGRTCQEWDYTSDDDNGKVWVTSGIGNWWAEEMAGQADKIPPDERGLVKLAVEQKLFPMKWETDDKSGNDRASMVVVKLEKKSLDSSLFGPPAGYKKFDMGNMFGGGKASSGANQDGNKDFLSNVKPKLPF